VIRSIAYKKSVNNVWIHVGYMSNAGDQVPVSIDVPVNLNGEFAEGTNPIAEVGADTDIVSGHQNHHLSTID
jgi:hypothetical protein